MLAWLKEDFTVPPIGKVATLVATGTSGVFADGEQVVMTKGNNEFAGIVTNPEYHIISYSYTFKTVSRTKDEATTIPANRVIHGHGLPPETAVPIGPGAASARQAAS
jgi:hypothetical protein